MPPASLAQITEYGEEKITAGDYYRQATEADLEESFMFNKIIGFSLFLAAFMSFSVGAQIEQTVEISSSPNPVGSGARALAWAERLSV